MKRLLLTALCLLSACSSTPNPRITPASQVAKEVGDATRQSPQDLVLYGTSVPGEGDVPDAPAPPPSPVMSHGQQAKPDTEAAAGEAQEKEEEGEDAAEETTDPLQIPPEEDPVLPPPLPVPPSVP